MIKETEVLKRVNGGVLEHLGNLPLIPYQQQ